MKRKKIWIFTAIIFILIVFGVSVFIFYKKYVGINKVCFNDNCFSVEVARSPDELGRGLMFRESLPQDEGMLFIFEKSGYYNFWMKNTLIPLDMIWINESKEVVFIANDVQPCAQDPCPEIVPNRVAKYVLEVNAGAVGKIGLIVGSKAQF